MSTITVERSEQGPHPLSAGDRMWNKGDRGEMGETEARARIEQGYFIEVTESPIPDPEE